MKPSEILEKALDLIRDPECWIQRCEYGFRGDKHCYCAFGALTAVERFAKTASDAEKFSAFVFLRKVIGTNDIDDIQDWNDDPNTTHAEVVAAFEEAIKRAKEAGE